MKAILIFIVIILFAGISSADELKDLPIVEVSGNSGEGQLFAVMISGDGGWASIDRDVSGVLASNGIPVVGLNSLKYFWKHRSPEECAADLSIIITHYMKLWKKEEVILIGFSFGADVLPFMATRIPYEQFRRVPLIVMLSPGEKADFEFHVMNWFSSVSDNDSRAILPELAELKGKKLLCFAGEEETESLCFRLEDKFGKRIIMPGGHHYNGQYEKIASIIMKELQFIY